MSKPIATARLVLEPLRPQDADDLFEIMRDPAIGAAMGEPPPASVSVTRERIAAWMRGPDPAKGERWLNWLARTQEGRPVAHLPATVQGAIAWLAWIVAVDYQRQGFATECARAIMAHLAAHGVNTFAASIPKGHLASEGVVRNLDMRLTDEIADGERVWRTVQSPG